MSTVKKSTEDVSTIIPNMTNRAKLLFPPLPRNCVIPLHTHIHTGFSTVLHGSNTAPTHMHTHNTHRLGYSALVCCTCEHTPYLLVRVCLDEPLRHFGIRRTLYVHFAYVRACVVVCVSTHMATRNQTCINTTHTPQPPLAHAV